MSFLIVLIILIYFGISVARYLLNKEIYNHTVPYTRYLYVVLHEISHAFIGILTGCGVEAINLKTQGNLAAYYQPKYLSRLRLLGMDIGGALTALAGPILPPLLIYLIINGLTVGDTIPLILTMTVSLILILLYSPQRLYFLGAFILLYLGIAVGLAEIIVLLLTIWFLLGQIEEIFIVGGYNEKGSDMGVAVESLFGLDVTVISWILNKFVQVYYLYIIIQIIVVLTQTI